MAADIEKLKHNNEELREIVNNSWDGIGIMDDNSKFIYVNNAFSPILGFSKDELLGTLFVDYVSPNNQNDFTQLIEENKLNQYSNKIQLVCLRKDKQSVYLDVTLSLMLNKKFFVVNIKDITKQISDDQILNEYALSSQMDNKGMFTKISNAFTYLSGYEKDELIGKHFSVMVNESKNKDQLKEIWDTLHSKKEWSGKILSNKKEGSLFCVDTKIKPIYNKYGDTTGYTSLMFDITAELELKEEISVANTQIEQKDKILVQQSKLAIMAETLQMISHEWRQPLNIISLRAQKLELDFQMDAIPSNNEVEEVLNDIKKQADNLSTIIEDFQSFVSLKDVKNKIKPDVVIKKAIKIFMNDPDNQHIDIIKDYSNEPEFLAYSNELTTVLVNILLNAKEAIDRNNIKNGVIKLKQYHLDNFIYFEISDNGGGIDDSIIEKIFDPYFSTKKIQHGVGLGLYMCKMIVQVHLGGEITALNHNTGSTFVLKLPLSQKEIS
ncbi:MAG: PAS domain S-box protein [Campylobacterota bacterium]|nr:PAS domain S-box protein [Campylobacterota bacterium]